MAFSIRALLLLLGVFFGVLARLVMTNDTAGASAQNPMMAGNMPSNPTNRCPF
jgi:hypothetical protein